MAKFYDELTSELVQFIAEQQLFFTATAPIDGRINLSPKGMDTFCCISSKEVAYLDLTGSGNETSAHLAQNGRMTVMFCSFSQSPLILRLYGTGCVMRPRDPLWSEYLAYFEVKSGVRQIMRLAIESVQTSCGFGVPLYEYQGDRPQLLDWAAAKGPTGIAQYWQAKNQRSIDGLPTHLAAEEG